MAKRRVYRNSAPQFASVDDVADFAANLPDRYLLCRELNHNWRPFTAHYADGGFERILRCTRCRTEKHQSLTPSGAVMSSKYVYANGYLTEHGIGRIAGDARDRLRLESITRVVAHNEE